MTTVIKLEVDGSDIKWNPKVSTSCSSIGLGIIDDGDANGTTQTRAGKIYVGRTVKSPCRVPGFLDPAAAVLEPLIEAGAGLLGKDLDLSDVATVCHEPPSKPPEP